MPTMHRFEDTDTVADSLRRGAVGVLPTDTLYGVVARADDAAAVERIYEVKARQPNKPLIILIDAIERVNDFGIELDAALRRSLSQYWPGSNSVILPCLSESYAHLHRGHGSLAFRLPDDRPLCNLLAKSGPLVAPSANPEGLAPADSIDLARGYFGDGVDFYLDDGARQGEPSQLYIWQDGYLQNMPRNN